MKIMACLFYRQDFRQRRGTSPSRPNTRAICLRSQPLLTCVLWKLKRIVVSYEVREGSHQPVSVRFLNVCHRTVYSEHHHID